jgi:23S rRNA (cytidine1920-2'-O)/16S rRNA (cytidine1409-2'-O)-methyltransferase
MSGRSRNRLDAELVRRGLVESRSKAQAMIMAGDILVDGQVVLASSKPVNSEQEILLRERQRFVSRGGEKLEHALETFPIPVEGAICADFGASTGGFTDCLLQHGAMAVYSVDVGYGQIAARLRADPKVRVLDRTNVRYVKELDEPIDLLVADLSFISLTLIFPAILRVTREGADCVLLIKPQFEAGRSEVGKGGVVRDSAVHREVLQTVLSAARENGLIPLGLTVSPLRGPAGNVEFLAWLRRGGPTERSIEDLVASAMSEPGYQT